MLFYSHGSRQHDFLCNSNFRAIFFHLTHTELKARKFKSQKNHVGDSHEPALVMRQKCTWVLYLLGRIRHFHGYILQNAWCLHLENGQETIADILENYYQVQELELLRHSAKLHGSSSSLVWAWWLIKLSIIFWACCFLTICFDFWSAALFHRFSKKSPKWGLLFCFIHWVIKVFANLIMNSNVKILLFFASEIIQNIQH